MAKLALISSKEALLVHKAIALRLNRHMYYLLTFLLRFPSFLRDGGFGYIPKVDPLGD